MKHIAIFVGLITFLLAGQPLQGQKKRGQKETIHLKDGSVLRGRVIEDNEYFIRMIIETGDTLQIGYKNIVDEAVSSSKRRDEQPRTYLDQGWFYDIGLRGELKDNFRGAIYGRIGHRLSPRWYLGLELGFLSREEDVNFTIFETTYAHLNPYVRYYLNQGKPRFFVYGSAGYSFGISSTELDQFNFEDHDGKLIAFAGGGLHFGGRKKVRWIINIGASYHAVSGEMINRDPWVGEVITNYSREYITPTVGVTVEF